MTEKPPPPLPSPDLPPLDSEPVERRLVRPWQLAVIGVFVGYPLSVGPVAWICLILDPTKQYIGYVQAAYVPIKFLYETLPPVRAFYNWYLGLFGVG